MSGKNKKKQIKTQILDRMVRSMHRIEKQLGNLASHSVATLKYTTKRNRLYSIYQGKKLNAQGAV
jgi:hypothetical protein